MEIKWFGQSCFEIKTTQGTIVTDPFGDSVGFVMPSLRADVLTISHQHFDHNNKAKVAAGQIVETASAHQAGEIKITGWSAPHDEQGGAERGQVIIFRFEVEGMNLVHLGDLGTELSDDQVAQIGSTDILFIPVGGNYTLDIGKAAEVVRQLQPKIVIPMHYKIPNLKIDLAGPEKFIKALGITPEYLNKLEITPKELEKPQRLVILDRVTL